MKQNWLTWNMDRLQRASKQGLAFQVNVRNASIHIRLFATGKKWPFCSRCEQEMMFFPLFVLATGLKCGFCSRCAQDCLYSLTLRQWRSASALEGHEKWVPCATHWIFIRVAQLMWLGVRYNGDRVRHRLGK